MNLHDISYRSNMPLIAEYVRAYYHMERTRVNADGVSIDYQFDNAERWDNLDSRATLSYTNAAIAWDLRGRPHLE